MLPLFSAVRVAGQGCWLMTPAAHLAVASSPSYLLLMIGVPVPGEPETYKSSVSALTAICTTAGPIPVMQQPSSPGEELDILFHTTIFDYWCEMRSNTCAYGLAQQSSYAAGSDLNDAALKGSRCTCRRSNEATPARCRRMLLMSAVKSTKCTNEMTRNGNGNVCFHVQMIPTVQYLTTLSSTEVPRNADEVVYYYGVLTLKYCRLTALYQLLEAFLHLHGHGIPQDLLERSNESLPLHNVKDHV